MINSKKILFKVKKDAVLKKIATNSFYRGERVKDSVGAVAARMQSGEDNNDILTDEIDIAVIDVLALVVRNLGYSVLRKDCAITETGEIFTDVKTGSATDATGKVCYVAGADNHPAVMKVGGTFKVFPNGVAGESIDVTITSVADYVFDTDAASNFPEGLVPAAEECITSYLFDRTLEGWLLVNMPDEVTALANRSAADLEKLRQVLIEREKPIR